MSPTDRGFNSRGGNFNANSNNYRGSGQKYDQHSPQDRPSNQHRGNVRIPIDNPSIRTNNTNQARQISGKMLTNHFRIQSPKVQHLFQYPLEITKVFPPGKAPLRPAGALKRRIIYLFIKKLSGNSGKLKYASDYDNFLVAIEQLPAVVRNSTHNILYYKDEETSPPANGPQYTVTVTGESQLSLTAMRDFFNDPSRTTPDLAARNATLRCLNIIFSHGANLYSFTDLGIGPRCRRTVTNIGSKRYYQVALRRPAVGKETGPWSLPTEPGLEALTGFFLSVRAPVGGPLLLNLNTTTSAFYAPGNLWDLICRRQNINSTQEMTATSMGRLASFLTGACVITNYIDRSSRAKNRRSCSEMPSTITGLPSTTQVPTAVNTYFPFRMNGNTTMKSVYDYFRDLHPSIRLERHEFVVSVGSQPSFIPARLLHIEAGQYFRQKTDMVDSACRPPKQNYDKIMDGGKTIFGLAKGGAADPDGPSATFNGIDINPNMLRVDATILPGPGFGYAGGRVTDDDISKGRWNLVQRAFTKPTSSGKRWSVLELRVAGQEHTSVRDLETFFNKIGGQMRNYGITSEMVRSMTNQQLNASLHVLTVTHPARCTAATEATEEISIRAKLNAIERSIPGNRGQTLIPLDLVFVLFPMKSANLYALLKRVGDQICGIRTICIVCGNQREGKFPDVRHYWGPKMTPQLIGNLLLKFNLKMDVTAVNQTLNEQIPILDGGTMMMGMDVTHPGAGAQPDAPSAAAVVGSIDGHFAQFLASLSTNHRDPTSKHGKSREDIDKLDELVYERLAFWITKNNQVPRKLIIYRDGLSEEQFDMCQTIELPKVKHGITKALRNFRDQDATPPKILLICTVKRHHTRFFKDDSGASAGLVDSNQNPVPGCMINNTVTRGEGKDFFLYSHNTIQGTAKPTHYVVLENGLDETLDNIAKMTHSICYLFQRATRSVSLAPPAYYAHLAADRARCYARDVYVPWGPPTYVPGTNLNLRVHANLKDTMFYI